MTDLLIAPELHGRFRRDWGLKNSVPIAHAGAKPPTNDQRQRAVRHKIARFTQTAIYPQQLTVPRQYATTREGVFVYKIFEGRVVDGIQEQGARVIVQENKRQARFVVSPLMGSKHDALTWARQQMGAEIGDLL